jgi:hypothetical protein
MPPKVVSQATIEAAKRKANPGPRAPVYGAWERFKLTENPGYTWFPFDVINWLTSPIVNAMSPTAQGVYIRLLAVQWRDGYVSTDPKSLAVQTGFDARTCVGWFNTWGDRLFVCLDHPEGGCDVFATLRNCQEPSVTAGKYRKVPITAGNCPELPVTCGKCVNGKLYFLAIKQGKVSLAANTEERRVNGDGNRDRDLHTKDGRLLVDASSSLTEPTVYFEEYKHGCYLCNQPAAACTCQYTCSRCDKVFEGIDRLAEHVTGHGYVLTLHQSNTGVSSWVGVPDPELDQIDPNLDFLVEDNPSTTTFNIEDEDDDLA